MGELLQYYLTGEVPDGWGTSVDEARDWARHRLATQSLEERERAALAVLVRAADALEAALQSQESLEIRLDQMEREHESSRSERKRFDQALAENWSRLTPPMEFWHGMAELVRWDLPPYYGEDGYSLIIRSAEPPKLEEAIEILAKFYGKKPSSMVKALQRAKRRLQDGESLEFRPGEYLIGKLPRDVWSG